MIHSRKRRFYAHGFTIVELLIVIVVIAILAAITIVSYNGISNTARVSTAAQGLRQIEKSMRLWAIDEAMTEWPYDATYPHGGGGTFLSDMIADNPKLAKYIQSVPSVPGIDSDEWFYDNDGDAKPAPPACYGAYDGVNIVIRYTANSDFVEGLDKTLDDGDLNCGKMRYQNNIIFYALDYTRTITQ
ncbi:MAG: type II secretion system protein [Candidatus Microsaccharimonas sp.]